MTPSAPPSRPPAEVTLPSENAVCVRRTFDAPVDLVWRAYTEPALMHRWLLGPPGWSMPVCDMHVRTRGTFLWRWRNDDDGKEFGFSGEFKEVVLHQKIVSTELFDPGDVGGTMGEGATVNTVTFEESGGVTTMTTLIEYASQADRDAALATGMTDGMEMSYKRLDAVLDGGAG